MSPRGPPDPPGPPGAQGALTRLRELCRAELKGFDEVMAYGMPAYERDGTAEIAFAAEKQYISPPRSSTSRTT